MLMFAAANSTIDTTAKKKLVHLHPFDRTGAALAAPAQGPDPARKPQGPGARLRVPHIRDTIIANRRGQGRGFLWTYMGPAEQRPPLPEFEICTVQPEQRFISKRLQAMKGGIDSTHVSFLHSGALSSDPLFKGAGSNKYNLGDKRPVFEVVDAPGGLFIGARRNAGEALAKHGLSSRMDESYELEKESLPPSSADHRH